MQIPMYKQGFRYVIARSPATKPSQSQGWRLLRFARNDMRVLGLFEALAVFLLWEFAPARGKADVSGRIVDYLARPVEGAEVVLYEEIRDFSTDRDVAKLRDGIRRTDAEGRFAFRADIVPSYRFFIVARKQGLALAWDSLERVSENVIVLERTCILAGVVVDAAGKPVAGAKVQAIPKTSYLRRLEQRPIIGPESWLTSETDSLGSFRFEEFAADVSTDFWVKAPGRALVYVYSVQRMTVCGFEAGRTDIRLVLPEEVAVRGCVVDAQSGSPVANVRVVIHPDMAQRDCADAHLGDAMVTGEDGRFVFRAVPRGRHYVDVSAPYDTGLVDRRVRFEARGDPNAEEIVVRLDRGGAIEFEAREERTNEPVAGMTVTFYEAAQDEQASFCKHLRTGDDGMLRIQAPAALCEFYALLDAYFPWSCTDQVHVTAGEMAKVQVALILMRYRRVSGLVVDESGRPVQGAAVNDGVTDDAGRFEMAFPSDDSVFGSSWIVRHAGENLAAVVDAQWDDQPIRITASPAMIVSGRIVDPNGTGIPAARIALHMTIRGRFTPGGPEVVTDSRGRYEIRAVIGGQTQFDHRISVHASGYGIRQYRRIAIEGEPGSRVELDPIVLLPATESVTGVVVDAKGNPAAFMPMAVRGENQSARHPATDKDGRFVVRRVCKGPLRIQAGFSDVREETGTLRVEGGDRDVKVVLGQDAVHPRSASLLGKPLPRGEDLDAGLPQADAKGKMILLCFFDVQQRPSRNMIVELGKRAEQLNGRGVALFGVQASKMDRTEFDKWIADNHVAFPVGMIQADEEKMRRTWGVPSLPWLILTDRAHTVAAEGSQLAEFERHIEEVSDAKR